MLEIGILLAFLFALIGLFYDYKKDKKTGKIGLAVSVIVMGILIFMVFSLPILWTIVIIPMLLFGLIVVKGFLKTK